MPRIGFGLVTACLAALALALPLDGAALANDGGGGFSEYLRSQPAAKAKPPRKSEPAPKAPVTKAKAPSRKASRAAAAPPRTVRASPPRARSAPRGPVERAQSGMPAEGEERLIADQVVVRYRLASRQADRDALVRRLDLRHLEGRTFPLAGVTVHRYAIANGDAVRTVIAALERDPSVVSAQPNYLYALQQAARAAGPAQYALKRLSVGPVHPITRGKGVTVAIIDSGIDADHPDLAAAAITAIDLVGGSGDGADAHGTIIAGVIAAGGALAGVAPEARLVAVRAFAVDPSSGRAESSTWTVATALERAHQAGSAIVNMSFAGPRDPLVEASVAGAARRGMVMVAAAGNAGPKSAPLYPAAYGDVLAVTATDAADAIYAQANQGSYVAFAAPGVDILGLAPDGGYDVSSGTSLSAAYVSGLAALLVSRDATLKRKDLAEIFAASSADLGQPGVDPVFGGGLPNAEAALAAVGVRMAGSD